MIRWFKRTRPTPAAQPAQISPEDRAVASWFGYTPNEWAALANHIRVSKRSGYFQARGL